MSSRSQSRWLPRRSACAWDLDRDCFARLAAASLGSWVGLGLGCWLIWGSPVEEYLEAYCVCVWHCRPVHLGGRWRIGVLTGGYTARVNETGQQRWRVKFDPWNKVSVMRGNPVVVWIVTCLEARWKGGCYGHSVWGGGPCWRKGRGSMINGFVGADHDLHGTHRSPWLTLTLTLKWPVLSCTSTLPGFREWPPREEANAAD